jgi:microcystin-dependent protein
MSYAYSNGDGLAVLDPLTPNGAVEPVAILDDAIRQIKAYLKDPTVGPEALINAVTAAANPPGTGKAYFGGTIPAGYLACDGSAVSRTTYPALFDAIGTTWGAGDGSTTFNLPDTRGRVLNGEGLGDAVTATAWALAQKAGEEIHVLSIPQMPGHSHVLTNLGNGNADGNDNNSNQGVVFNGVGPAGALGQVTGVAGGDQPHNNLQPLVTVKWIIKT